VAEELAKTLTNSHRMDDYALIKAAFSQARTIASSA